MDVTDTCGQEINAKICNHLALVRICTLTHTNNAVFLATDRANLCLKGHAMLSCDLNKLFCLFYVLLDWIMRSIEHNG